MSPVALRPLTLIRLIAAAVMTALGAWPAYAATIEERLTACLACHGATGQSGIPGVPSLGGQPVFYLTVQLLMFRDKLRVVEPMNQAMQGVKDDELREIAARLGELPPPMPAGGPVNTERKQRAQAVIAQNRCDFCHQKNYSGENNVPRLAGQREDYLAKAMQEYKNGNRRGYDASMADVLYPVTDEQILDLAYFLSRLR